MRDGASGAELVLEVVRPEVEAGRCPGCGRLLRGCRLKPAQVAPDRIEVEATCAGCGRATTLVVRPSAGPGGAEVR